MSRSWISALFSKFQIIYGSKWTSQIAGLEDLYIDEWREGLKNLNGKQIKNGLNECRLQDWPPSMGEFVKLCIGPEIPRVNCAAYKPFKSLPKPKVDKDKARAAIDEMKIKLS